MRSVPNRVVPAAKLDKNKSFFLLYVVNRSSKNSGQHGILSNLIGRERERRPLLCTGVVVVKKSI